MRETTQTTKEPTMIILTETRTLNYAETPETLQDTLQSLAELRSFCSARRARLTQRGWYILPTTRYDFIATKGDRTIEVTSRYTDGETRKYEPSDRQIIFAEKANATQGYID